jgi:hemerythrin
MQLAQDLVVGIAGIDKRHRDLIRKLVSLRQAVKEHLCRHTIDDMIAFLGDYVEVQFCEEKKYMRRYGYPSYPLHRERHELFKAEVLALKEELLSIRATGAKGSYELSVRTIQAVVDWINGHVRRDDKDLGIYLAKYPDINHMAASSSCAGGSYMCEGVMTMCSFCKKIRDKKGLWRQREHFGELPGSVLFSHGLCPECLIIYYADLFQEIR